MACQLVLQVLLALSLSLSLSLCGMYTRASIIVRLVLGKCAVCFVCAILTTLFPPTHKVCVLFFLWDCGVHSNGAAL